MRRLVNISRILPSIMEHRLGEPFVGKVLEHRVQKRDRWIVRDDRSRSEHLLEPPDLKRRVDHRLIGASVLTGKHEHRNQSDRNLGDADVFRRAAHDPGERNASKPQHRAHLARVRRPEAADQFQWCHPNACSYHKDPYAGASTGSFGLRSGGRLSYRSARRSDFSFAYAGSFHRLRHCIGSSRRL